MVKKNRNKEQDEQIDSNLDINNMIMDDMEPVPAKDTEDDEFEQLLNSFINDSIEAEDDKILSPAEKLPPETEKKSNMPKEMAALNLNNDEKGFNHFICNRRMCRCWTYIIFQFMRIPE